ncbi:MAG: hypothetical protein EBQ80_05120 [Proteobacteria bacterium]|nr:hypothetical protein [Pseudomonadota bacterium]
MQKGTAILNVKRLLVGTSLSLVLVSGVMWAYVRGVSADNVKWSNDEASLTREVVKLRAQLAAVEKDMLRRLDCQRSSKIANDVACIEVPGLRGKVKAKLDADKAAAAEVARQAAAAEAARVAAEQAAANAAAQQAAAAEAARIAAEQAAAAANQNNWNTYEGRGDGFGDGVGGGSDGGSW